MNSHSPHFSRFRLYHGLGNDYLVLDERQLDERLTAKVIQRICDRHFGIGADGLLLGSSTKAVSGLSEFKLRIFNPDGSEAEKSGNGLRIFSRYLFDCAEVEQDREFIVNTASGLVNCCVLSQGEYVRVAMGQISFSSLLIPVSGPQREVLREQMTINGRCLEYSAATVGNPHCVLLGENWSKTEVCELGERIERDSRFPNRVNVQFVEVLDRGQIKLSIWERGAGYTLASGSSSCAAAGVCYRLGLCDREITAHMPGGELILCLDDDFHILMQGPVVFIAEGTLSTEMLR